MAIEDYTYMVIDTPSKPGCWNTMIVKIYYQGNQIGEYYRNYPSIMNTFVPFVQRGKEYALYSEHYTATSVMRLPECTKIAYEDPSSYGFCPVDYFVPYKPECGIVGNFGFIAGCIWGDDSSWKIQFLDLRRIEDGLLLRDERFGYIELADNFRLKDAVDLSGYCLYKNLKHTDERRISIAISAYYTLNGNNQPISSYLSYKPFGRRGLLGIEQDKS